MVDIEWEDLEDLDFDAGSEYVDEETAKLLEWPRIGIRACDDEMVDEFVRRIEQKTHGRSAEFLMIDFRGCSATEDFQKKIIDVLTEYIKKKDASKAEKLAGDSLNEHANNCLVSFEELANEMRKNFTLAIDFRGVEVSPKMLRPGQNFWWVYDPASRCSACNLIWIMDDDEDAFELLASHGQMNRVFSDDGTNLFVMI